MATPSCTKIYCFQLVAHLLLSVVAAGAHGAITIQLNSKTYTTPATPALFAGVNTVLGPIVNLTYDDKGLLAAAQAVGTGLMRYPGGTVANFWSIVNGSYVPSCSSGACREFGPGISRMPPHTFTYDKFARGVAMVNDHSEPPLALLNVYNISTEDMVAQIDYLKSFNMSIPRFEIGNEFYASEYTIDALEYVNRIRPVIARIRYLFPKSTVAIVYSKNKNSTWNDNLAIAAASLDYDAVTVHDYSCNLNAALRSHSVETYMMAHGAVMLNFFIGKVDGFFGNNKPLWHTEYNIGNKEDMPGALWAVYQGTHVIAAARTKGRYETMNYHAFSAQDGVEWDDQSGMVRVGAQPDDVDAVQMGPVAAVFAHTSHFALGRQLWVPDVTNNPQLSFDPVPGQASRPDCIQPLVFTQDNSLSLPMRLMIANMCPQALPVELNVSSIDLSVTDTRIQMSLVGYPADRNGTTSWVLLKDFDPTRFPWPSHGAAFAASADFDSLEKVKLDLNATTLYYVTLIAGQLPRRRLQSN